MTPEERLGQGGLCEMPVAAGTINYSLGAPPVRGNGLSWTEQELSDAVGSQVGSLVFDDAGRADLQRLLAGVVETGFQRE